MREVYRGQSIEVMTRFDNTDWIACINGELQLLAHESAVKAMDYAKLMINKQTVALDQVA